MSFSGGSPWIKICGLTDPETAAACAGLGADAVGLVFHEKSPRRVNREQARAAAAALPPECAAIGVFVDTDAGTVLDTASVCGLKGVQLHGNEPPALAARLKQEGLWVIKALFARKPPFISQAEAFPSADGFLVECGRGKLPGGNARGWDYGISRSAAARFRVVLAGGLTSQTVASAIAAAKPWGVDVSSGVEAGPGIKDMNLVQKFISAVRQCRRDE